jgi:acyl-CoA synthetase (AMP-forming)/AMP-acid ligase II
MPSAIPNLVELVRQRTRDCPDCAAYIFLASEDLRQSSLTYGELDFQARLIAGLLQGQEAQGERALLLYPPGLEFIAAFFGCLYAGVIAVPAYPPRLNRNALRIVSIAKDSQARFALTSAEVLSRLGALTAHTPELGQLRWHATGTLHSDVAKEWQEFSPQASLLMPVEGGGDRHQVSQNNGIAAAQRRRQKQQRFLNIGGQVEQARDLADSRSCHLTQRCQGAVAGYLSRPHQFV